MRANTDLENLCGQTVQALQCEEITKTKNKKKTKKKERKERKKHKINLNKIKITKPNSIEKQL